MSRITPARAGKTACAGLCFRLAEDHPRACGENTFWINSVDLRMGSPPRVRGKLLSNTVRDGIRRITPARAGKTLRFC